MQHLPHSTHQSHADSVQQKLSEASSNYAIVHEQQQPMQQEPLEQESLEQESRKEPCKACKGNKKLAW
eukprot:1148812-Pelagomonas_calceolata.AAC.11